MPTSYIANPLIDVVVLLHETDEEPMHLDVSSYSTARGFSKIRLSRQKDPGFRAALRFLLRQDGDLAALGLSAAETRSLWQAGLLIAPDEQGETLVSKSFSASREEYDRRGFALIAECLTPAVTARLTAHYDNRIAHEPPGPGDEPDRRIIYNDPAARILQRELSPRVEQIVDSPIKSSYAYTLRYNNGASLPAHTDRQPNKYAVSLLLDHRPLSPDRISTWPLQFFVQPDSPAITCFEPVGGGVLFKAGEIRHGRPPLPPDEACWVMLLAYVDSDFEGPLD